MKISDFEKEKGLTYQQAKDYLISIGEWDSVCDQDGYTIVETAWVLKTRNQIKKN